MKIAFITNLMNHHQVYLADELYKYLGDEYKFIETIPIPNSLIQSGYPIISRPYVIKAYQNAEQMEKAKRIAEEADVVIIGSAPECFVTKRIQEGKMTFRYHERWFKDKPWFLSGPRSWMNFYKNHIRYKNKPLYMLAASAFTIHDVNAIGAYKNKVFKWGYFTKVDHDHHIRRNINQNTKQISIMWCARFIKLKHPELPIKMSKILKDKGYKFSLDMYGSGTELEKSIHLAQELNVNDVVNFCGNLPNDQILKKMQEHEIFLFTSDKREGWGAVLNESMANGCAVVASHLIGSVPFLIKDGDNGCIFKSENLDSLVSKVIYLIENPNEREKISNNAIKTMQEVWCPSNAAKQFLNLVKALQIGDSSLIPKDGPGSKAKRI